MKTATPIAGVTIDSGLVDPPVEQAIRIKLERMEDVPAEERPWLTYWLAVLKSEDLGIGLLGFKGHPGANGEVEIGYGIVADYRDRGLATEAASRLIEWAFTDPRCQAVVAVGVRSDNTASKRVLAKLGAKRVCRGERASDWRIDAAEFRDRFA